MIARVGDARVVVMGAVAVVRAGSGALGLFLLHVLWVGQVGVSEPGWAVFEDGVGFGRVVGLGWCLNWDVHDWDDGL